MKTSRVRLTLLLLALSPLASFLSGCESADPQESQLPWARPASWEGGAPGMGGSFDKGRTGY